MAKRPVGGFAELLQRLRVMAGMTQGELAEAAEDAWLRAEGKRSLS